MAAELWWARGGAGLFQDDMALDVVYVYRNLIAGGCFNAEAVRIVRTGW